MESSGRQSDALLGCRRARASSVRGREGALEWRGANFQTIWRVRARAPGMLRARNWNCALEMNSFPFPIAARFSHSIPFQLCYYVGG